MGFGDWLKDRWGGGPSMDGVRKTMRNIDLNPLNEQKDIFDGHVGDRVTPDMTRGMNMSYQQGPSFGQYPGTQSPFGPPAMAFNSPIAAGGVQNKDGIDKVSLAMMLMQALGTGFTAYSQAQQQKKDREESRRRYDEGAGVREEGRRRLLQPEVETPEAPFDFHSQGRTLQGGVAAPPPPGPTALRDRQLQDILRARLGGR